MSWYNRRSFLVLSLGALSACGFTPVYGPGGQGRALMGAVLVDEPEDREDYELVKRLEERLGQPADARFRLVYEVEVSRADVGVTASQEITRTRLEGVLRYQLISLESGAQVSEGLVTNFTSFSNLGSTVSTASVERDAYRRLMVILADMVVTRLTAQAPDA